MARGHIPFGYRIENGAATICEREAQQVRDMFAGYLSGYSYDEAAGRVDLYVNHSTAKRMLQDEAYLGDGFYPAIIDRETFDAVEKERLRRCAALGRGKKPRKSVVPQKISARFSMGRCEEELDDPYEQAAYLYSLIESEE